MSLLGSLVVLKERVRKAQSTAMIYDIDTTRLLETMELSLVAEIARVAMLEKSRGKDVGITKIDTYA
jgi:hypothetical protein